MFPLWNDVVEPLVLASGAQRVVEIGALRGENTILLLERLGPDSEVHVIDPVPEFDPAEHESAFGGRYVFHRDLSLNVLPEAPPFDVALVDGDHNWYTVYHELRELAATARRHDRDLPLLILHDVGWPYGRRDLYYAPEQIPEEYRQPHAKRGMAPHRKQLLNGGGMNITLDNALVEGGPRNGVMTAVDDFVAEHDRPLRQVVIPIYFGLAIVAEEAFLDAHPAVAEKLDWLESPEGVRSLVELAEQIRIDGVVFEHNIGRVHGERLERASSRYLSLLRSTLSQGDTAPLDRLHDRLDALVDARTRGVVVDEAADAVATTYAAAYFTVHEPAGLALTIVRDEADHEAARQALDEADAAPSIAIVDSLGEVRGDIVLRLPADLS